ncbi:hypothetical protein ABIA30_001247 [Mycobacterium sp. MAA66]
MWIGRSGPVDSTELDLLMTESPELDGWQAAMGRVAKGEVGFRISHRTADYARRFAAKASRQAAVTDSRTVGLAAHVVFRGRPINHRALEFHGALRALSLLDPGTALTLRLTVRTVSQFGH